MARTGHEKPNKTGLLERLAKFNIALGAVAIGGAIAAEAVGLISGNVAGAIIAFGALQFAEAAVEKFISNLKNNKPQPAAA